MADGAKVSTVRGLSFWLQKNDPDVVRINIYRTDLPLSRAVTLQMAENLTDYYHYSFDLHLSYSDKGEQSATVKFRQEPPTYHVCLRQMK